MASAYFCSETSEGPSAKQQAQSFTRANLYLFLVQLGVGPGKKILETSPTTTGSEVGFWLRQEPLSEPFHWLTASTTATSLMTSSWPLDTPRLAWLCWAGSWELLPKRKVGDQASRSLDVYETSSCDVKGNTTTRFIFLPTSSLPQHSPNPQALVFLRTGKFWMGERNGKRVRF